ncbi:TonB-dependent siderophore receptor [Pseudomonas sp. LRF_L74]|uniref:TonB-dependent siderophore receptor n=1 Tax=Pseudomonas sp. LRF_L74 TaxID=3369422 RepID=UPI003F642500
MAEPKSPRHAVRLALSGALLATPLAAGLVALPAWAQTAEAEYTFAIAAGSLEATIVEFSSVAGLTVSFEPAAAKGRNSPGVQGTFTAGQALQRLLQGSGMQAVPQSGGSYSLLPLGEQGGALELGATSVTGRQLGETTEGSGSYATGAVSIGKGSHKLKEIPQSITVMTRRQMDDQGLTDLRDAANQITGVVGVKGVGQGMVLSSRGFQIDAWQYDGVPVPRNMYALGNWATEGLVFFDRLEVLRGASGLLQGTGSPGGAVNLVRKRGQVAPTVSITGKAGSWDHYGLQLDAGGPLNAEGTLRGRMVVDEDRTHSFTDYAWSDTTSLYGALDYDLTPDTTIGVGISNSDNESRPMVRGFPRYPDGGDIGLPRSVYTGATWNRSEIEQTTLYADLEHRFDDNWKFKASALRMTEQNSSKHQRMHGDVAADGSGLMFADWITDFDATKLGADMYLSGNFTALSLEHEVILGGNYSKYTSDDMYARLFTANAGNIFNIDHHRPEPTLQSILAAGGRAFYMDYDVRQEGIYGSWRVKLSEDLTAVLGSRVSWYKYVYSATSKTTSTATGEITPYFGLVYALTDEWSAYASYTDVFEPQSERTVGGSVLDPIIGSNYELGLKGELYDGRLNTSFAVFRYDHENRAVNDYQSGFECDGWYCSTASGKVRSQGFELEASGEVLAGLQLSAGYTFNTTKFLDDPDNKGKVFSQWTPKHMLRVWSNYQLPGELSRISVGAGFNSQSHTLGYYRDYSIPGFTVWNARVAYQVTPEVGVALNANNLFDKRYYIPSYSDPGGNNMYGDPRNLMFTVKYTPQF